MSRPLIIDSHAHYDSREFDQDRHQLLSSMPSQGIEAIVNVGASLTGNEKTVELMEQYPFIYGSIGVHPDEVGDLSEEKMSWLLSLCQKEKTKAVGEIGLDYYWNKENKETQVKWFVRQMDLAKETQLPIVVHSRDAAKDTLDVMKGEKAEKISGVIHCFSYSKEIAREYLNMGFYLGIGGVVTFPDAKRLKEVVDYAPLDYLLLETDCPYLAPVPHRRERNSSIYLTYMAEEIAKIKGVSPETVIEITNQNAKKLFRIS